MTLGVQVVLLAFRGLFWRHEFMISGVAMASGMNNFRFYFNFRSVTLTLMHLLHSLSTLVQRSVDGSGYSQGSTDDGADADQKAGEALAACFSVNDLHW